MDRKLRFRTAEQAYNLIKEKDPDTAFTKCGIRSIITSGKVPVEKIGRKTLVNMDDLLDYLDKSFDK